jgi:uncharacterized protein (UPF0297 family)
MYKKEIVKESEKGIMNIEIKNNTVTVKRINDKEKFYSESQLLYEIKNELNNKGYNVIKKLMWKDGHLMGDNYTHYIRERNWKFAIFDGDWQIRLLHEDYNKNGYITLVIEELGK